MISSSYGYLICSTHSSASKVPGTSHFAVSYENSIDGNFECIEISDYLIDFDTRRVRIYNVLNTSQCIIEMKDSPLMFKDLDSSEKIEEIIKNYQLLC